MKQLMRALIYAICQNTAMHYKMRWHDSAHDVDMEARKFYTKAMNVAREQEQEQNVNTK